VAHATAGRRVSPCASAAERGRAGAAIAGNGGASAWSRTRHRPFGEAGAQSLTGSRTSEPEPRIGLGVHKGGRFTAGGAAIAHLWHGVITGYRSRAEGPTTPYAAFTP
jgi:hypothetical protein